MTTIWNLIKAHPLIALAAAVALYCVLKPKKDCACEK